jgi:hypothetical protein
MTPAGTYSFIHDPIPNQFSWALELNNWLALCVVEAAPFFTRFIQIIHHKQFSRDTS